MAGYKFERFIGQFPSRSHRLLEPNAAVIARDMRLGSGEIRPLGENLLIQRTVPPLSPRSVRVFKALPPYAADPMIEFVGDARMGVTSPGIPASAEVLATTPAAVSAASKEPEKYEALNSAGGEYLVPRAHQPGTLGWDLDKPLVLQFVASAWSRTLQMGESYEGEGVKTAVFRGTRPLADGTEATFELRFEHHPESQGGTVNTVHVLHRVSRIEDGTYGAPDKNPWDFEEGQVLINRTLAEVRSPRDTRRAWALAAVLEPSPDKSEVLLTVYSGADQVSQVCIPAALMPPFYDIEYRATGVSTTSANTQFFGITPAAGVFPDNYDSPLWPTGAVFPEGLEGRYVPGEASSSPLLLDAAFAPAFTGHTLWKYRVPFPLALSPESRWGEVFRFVTGSDDPETGQPLYQALTPVAALQKASAGPIGDVRFYRGVSPAPSSERWWLPFQWRLTGFGDSANGVSFQRAVFRVSGSGTGQADRRTLVECELEAEVEVAPKFEAGAVQGEVIVKLTRTDQDGALSEINTVIGQIPGMDSAQELTVTMAFAHAVNSPDFVVSINGGAITAAFKVFSTYTDKGTQLPASEPPRVSPSVDIYPSSSEWPHAAKEGTVTEVQFITDTIATEVPTSLTAPQAVKNLGNFIGEADNNLTQSEFSAPGTIHFIDYAQDDSAGFWAKLLGDVDFLGNIFSEDVHGRSYWAPTGDVFKVASIEEVFARSSLVGGTLGDGDPVGVPSASTLLSDIASEGTATPPAGEQYPITHAGLLKIPAFTADIADVAQYRTDFTTRLDARGERAVGETRNISYPETNYILIRTSRPDVRPPITQEGPITTLFARANTNSVTSNEMSKTSGEWANMVRHSQLRAYHHYPRGGSPSEASQGVMLVDPNGNLPGFTEGAFLQHSIRSQVRSAYSNNVPAFAGPLGALTYVGNGGGVTSPHRFWRSEADASIPANWKFIENPNTTPSIENRLPSTFDPVLITDPLKVFGSLWSCRGRFSANNEIQAYYTELFFPDAGVEYEHLSEEDLRSLWIFQIDDATFNSLQAGGVARFFPGTDFTPSRPSVVWDEVTVSSRRRMPEITGFNSLKWSWKSAPTQYGVQVPRTVGSVGITGVGDSVTPPTEVFEQGPLLMDPSSAIDWGKAELGPSASAYLMFDPVHEVPQAFDPSTEELAFHEIALVPYNIFEEEGPPEFVRAEYFANYPYAPVSITALLDRELADTYRVEGINVYRLEDDGVYYFYQKVGLPDKHRSPGALDFELSLGGPVDTAQPLYSLNFDLPPEGISAATRLSSGVVLLAAGDEVYPSAAGYPHAFPRQHKIPLESDVVGFGRFGNAVVACTTAQPYLITGDSPEDLRAERLDLDQACVSRGSIVSMEGQVIYASQEGLFSVGRGGTPNLTMGVIDAQEWMDLNPTSFRAYSWEGKYLCFFEGNREGQSFIFDPRQPDAGLVFSDQSGSAGFSSVGSPELFFLDDGAIYQWGAGEDKPWTWGGRFTRRSRDGNPGRLKVSASKYPVVLSLWVDGTHRVCDEWVIPDDRPQALPSGYLGEEYFIRLKGRGDLVSVEFGDSIRDIQRL